MRLDGFWIEAGELRFQRFGGIIGVALAEVVRLIPEEIAPVPGRTQVRFVRQLAPDLLEVAVKSGLQGVRLLGITPVELARTEDSPWRRLDSGAIVYLEFDRQRYDAEGNWLAYVFLPSNRMLNAELIRLGLARPLADGRNLRYLDLFHELATGELPEGVATAKN
jgi:endonuclease YncB( thermonuclease family)